MAFEIISAIATWSDCYKSGKKLAPTGIVVHSTGCNNPNLKRYVNAPAQLGKNVYKNWWGAGTSYEQEQYGIPHAAIGYDKNKIVKVAQVLPFEMRCWGCGSGKNGSYNTSHIQFEICEDSLSNKAYFEAAFDLAARFCAELMRRYPAIKINNIVSHKEANARGYASAHGDPENWLSKFGKSMSWFREKVRGYCANTPAKPPVTPTKPVNVSNVKVGDIVQFKGGGVYMAADAIFPNVTRGASRCKVTVTHSGKHPYHLVSEDGKGVYGWVNASDVEGATTESKPAPAPSGGKVAVKVGDIVTFTGGKVYASADAAASSAAKGMSICKVTNTHNGKHPYHLISEDGRGVYGWVDSANVIR